MVVVQVVSRRDERELGGMVVLESEHGIEVESTYRIPALLSMA